MAAAAASASAMMDGDVNEKPWNTSRSSLAGVPAALSTASFFVHCSSKHATHISPCTVGRNGGDTPRTSILFQSTALKNACPLTLSVPSGPTPKRLSCCLSSNPLMRPVASPGRNDGIFSLCEQMAFWIAGLFFPRNGNCPVSISYISTPTDHQSAVLPCPVACRISGAM